jgi:hypothetical protein
MKEYVGRSLRFTLLHERTRNQRWMSLDGAKLNRRSCLNMPRSFQTQDSGRPETVLMSSAVAVLVWW